jgi:uncharacterized protein YkwD
MIKKNLILLLLICVLASCSSAQKTASVSKQKVVFPTETGNFRVDMLAAVNFVRSKGCRCGNKMMPPVPAITWNSQLEGAAIRHAADMAKNKRFNHVGSDGSEIDTRITETGYKWMQIGENIAWGYNTIAEVMAGWVISVSHCEQLLSPKINEIGAAKNGTYWVQDFGKQRNW